MWGPLFAWMKKQMGQQSDAASTTGSVHAKLTTVERRPVIASNTLKWSADTERTEATQTYVKKKEILIYVAGMIRVSFDLKGSAGSGYQVWGRVYKNGSAAGTERSVTGTTYTTYTEDLSVAVGDLIQLYSKGNTTGGETAYVRNFRISYDFPAVEGVVNTD